MRAEIGRALDLTTQASRSSAEGVPAELVEAVGALLDWKAESAATLEFLGALVLYHSTHTPAVAHVGGEEPRLSAPGHTVTPIRVTLQGADGSIARAICTRPGNIESLDVRWGIRFGQDEARQVDVQCHWTNVAAKPLPGPSVAGVAKPPGSEVKPPVPVTPAPASPVAGRTGWLSPAAESLFRDPRPLPPSTPSAPAAPAAPTTAAPTLAPTTAVVARAPAAAATVEATTPIEATTPLEDTPSEPSLVLQRRPVLASHRLTISSRVVRVFALSLAALFALGWWIGARQAVRNPSANGRNIVSSLNLAQACYECTVSSRPEGARIDVDGKPRSRSTPATLLLKPGPHMITLSVDEAGSDSFVVRGNAHEQVTLDADLRGSLVVRPPADGTPVIVSMDGVEQGWAPVTIDHVTPGPHVVSFSVPGSPSSEEVVQISVRERSELTARSLIAPSGGEVEVRVQFLDPSGPGAPRSALVWVDGRSQGRAPLVLRLPRGRHSFRAVYQGEQSAIQVIDLPGGNRRYVELTLGSEMPPRLELIERPARAKSAPQGAVGARLAGFEAGDIAEMWLYVRGPRSTWVRYPMSILDRPGGVEGHIVVPHSPGVDLGFTSYYVSALTPMGDEYFTEIQNPVSTGAIGRVGADESEETSVDE